MDNGSIIKPSSTSLLILFLVFIFVMCSLFMILYGANVYTNINNRMDDDFAQRMSVYYITNKIRACDVRGGVEVYEDSSVIRLCSNPDDTVPQYISIYYYDGGIMEYISQDIEGFNPGEGELIMEADSFSAWPLSSGIEVKVSVGGEEISYAVSLKCI